MIVIQKKLTKKFTNMDKTKYRESPKRNIKKNLRICAIKIEKRKEK